MESRNQELLKENEKEALKARIELLKEFIKAGQNENLLEYADLQKRLEEIEKQEQEQKKTTGIKIFIFVK